MREPISIGVALCLAFGGGIAQADVWPRHTVDAHAPDRGKVGADGVRLADVNGDGRPDVVTGWENGDAIRVCLHPGADDVRDAWPAVTVGRTPSAEDAVFADLDGEGVLDVVSCVEGKVQGVFVHWGPAEASRILKETAWTMEAFPTLEGRTRWMFALPLQVDGRGGIDLVLGSKNPSALVGWLQNPTEPRDTGSWKLHRAARATWIMSLRDHDVDGDGQADIIYSDRKGASSGIYWLKGTGDAQGFEAPRLLGGAGREVMFLDIADANGDGHADVICGAKAHATVTLLHPGGKGVFGEWEEVSWDFPAAPYGTAKAVKVADMDEDGRQDVVITCEQARGTKVGAFLVSDAWGERRHLDFGGLEGVKFDRIELLDLDGDGDLDVLTCEERAKLGVFWYENPARS